MPAKRPANAASREDDHGIRLFHAERQSLRKQHALLEPVRRRHHRRGALCRQARHALGLDRRASFQFARRAVLPGHGARLCRRQHQAHPAGAGGHRAAAASSDPRRRAMGDARSACPAAASISPAAAATTGANICRSTSRSTTTRASSKKAWKWCARLWAADGRISHHGKYYSFDDVRITPKPVQRPMPTYVGSFSKPSIELAARLGCGLIVAPFAAAMSYGGLQAGRRPLPRDLRQARQKARPADVQLFHALRRQQGAGGRAARAADPLLQGMRDPGVPGRSEDRAAELSLFHRHRRAAAAR